MSDKEIDEKLAILSNEDLESLAAERPSCLRWYRSGPLYVRMATELLALRKALLVKEKA